MSSEQHRSEQNRRGVAATRMPRRATDIVEDAAAWVLLAVVLLLVVVAVAVGSGTRDRIAERARVEAGDRTTVTATLLAAAAPDLPVRVGYRPRVGVEAQWTGPDGGTRTGRIPVPGGAAAGEEVRVWVDRDGAPAKPPLTEFDAVSFGVLSGLRVLLVGAVPLGLAWLLVLRATAALNSRRWEREWAQVGPDWSAQR
ncbi:Rv1733c family protein [Pseudonocardia hydrocarbonoxydans]|uniref:Rv1733c family protein n=1 Tax=Pseudonocardia hydrocarbonoxydans TaxID=76726 RepID=UPI0031DA49E5